MHRYTIRSIGFSFPAHLRAEGLGALTQKVNIRSKGSERGHWEPIWIPRLLKWNVNPETKDAEEKAIQGVTGFTLHPFCLCKGYLVMFWGAGNGYTKNTSVVCSCSKLFLLFNLKRYKEIIWHLGEILLLPLFPSLPFFLGKCWMKQLIPLFLSLYTWY